MEYKDIEETNQAKKIVLFICIGLITLGILFMACGAFAQNTFYIGPYLGIGNQQTYSSNFYNDPSVKITHVPSTSFGANLQDSMNGNITLGFGLGYSGYSTQAQYTDKTAEDGTITGTYYDNYGYMTAPISLMIKSRTTTMNSIGFFGQVQLIPAMNISAKQKQTLYGSTLTIDTAANVLANIKNQTHAFNLMVGFSGGLVFDMSNTMIMVGPYYTTSLIDAKSTPTTNYTTVSGTPETYTPTLMRSLGVNVTVAIKINTHKKTISMPVTTSTETATKTTTTTPTTTTTK